MGGSSVAPVAAGLGIGIAFVIIFSILIQNSAQYRMYGHSGATPASWYFIEDKIEDVKMQIPDAMVKKGTAPEMINGVPLTLVAISSEGTGYDDPDDPRPVLKDMSGVSFSMYHGKNGDNETIVLTIENNSSDDIAVFVLGIHGFIRIDIPETGAEIERGTMYKSIISDKYDVGRPPIISPYWILAGDSLNAYIQGDFDVERYSSSMCYSYDLSDRTLNSNYCIRLS